MRIDWNKIITFNIRIMRQHQLSTFQRQKEKKKESEIIQNNARTHNIGIEIGHHLCIKRRFVYFIWIARSNVLDEVVRRRTSVPHYRITSISFLFFLQSFYFFFFIEIDFTRVVAATLVLFRFIQVNENIEFCICVNVSWENLN